jgi:hypothetical protein
MIIKRDLYEIKRFFKYFTFNNIKMNMTILAEVIPGNILKLILYTNANKKIRFII